MKEKDIIFESGKYWVGKTKDSYTVFQIGITCSTSVESFPKTADGLSIAIYYCQYKDITSQRMSTKECVALANKLHK